MAYLNFSELQGSPVAAPAELTVSSGFSALEWSVVAIARNDGLNTLKAPGRIAMALGTVFGGLPNRGLADPRLEALRRVAVHAWRKGYAVPLAEIRAFHDAGYSKDQYETLLASISRGRAARSQGNRNEYAYAG